MNYLVLMLVADQLQLDRRVLHEASSLAGQGCYVRIISLCPGMCKPGNLPERVIIQDAADLMDSSNISSSLATRKLVILRLAKKYIPRVIQEIGYFGIIHPAQRMARNFGSMEIGKWDVIIAHDLPLLPLAFALQNKTGDGKVILDAHELYDEQKDFLITGTARRYWRSVEDTFLPRCDGVMTVTPRIAEELKQRHDLGEVPTVLLNSCPYIKEPKEKGLLYSLYDIPSDKPVVLCQGGLSPGRSLEEFIEAWEFINKPKPALVFLGFGREDYVKSLKTLVKKKSLEKDVFLGKAVAPDEVLKYTCGASLGLISNRGEGINNTDGGPNRLFEYIQARIPILSYEHNGVRQILEQTGTGWVIGWESPRQLAEIIMDKLAASNRIERESLNKAAEAFCWENQAHKLFALLNRVLS